jgi:hypothetical protein
VLKLVASSPGVRAERLPSGPEASVGILVHRVLEQWARGHGSDDPLVLFETEYDRLRAELRCDVTRQHFADLTTTKSPQAWVRLRRWIADRCRRVDRRASKIVGPELGDARPGVPTGPERSLSCDRLRLGGQADRIRELGPHLYEVRDFKSGNAVDDDGEVKPAIQLQLRAYGLMVLDLDAKATVRLIVDDGDVHDVNFDAKTQAEALEEVRSIVGRVPLAGTAAAKRMATPGAGCFGCSIRHVCSAYREAAPQWWRSFPSDVARLPNDTWGTLVQVIANPRTSSADLVLIDGAGRRVRVDAVDARHDVASSPVRSRVWLFGLEATGPTRGFDGKRFHPRVFHELPRDAHERRAWGVRCFVEH